MFWHSLFFVCAVFHSKHLPYPSLFQDKVPLGLGYLFCFSGQVCFFFSNFIVFLVFAIVNLQIVCEDAENSAPP